MRYFKCFISPGFIRNPECLLIPFVYCCVAVGVCDLKKAHIIVQIPFVVFPPVVVAAKLN